MAKAKKSRKSTKRSPWGSQVMGIVTKRFTVQAARMNATLVRVTELGVPSISEETEVLAVAIDNYASALAAQADFRPLRRGEVPIAEGTKVTLTEKAKAAYEGVLNGSSDKTFTVQKQAGAKVVLAYGRGNTIVVGRREVDLVEA